MHVGEQVYGCQGIELNDGQGDVTAPNRLLHQEGTKIPRQPTARQDLNWLGAACLQRDHVPAQGRVAGGGDTRGSIHNQRAETPRGLVVPTRDKPLPLRSSPAQNLPKLIRGPAPSKGGQSTQPHGTNHATHTRWGEERSEGVKGRLAADPGPAALQGWNQYTSQSFEQLLIKSHNYPTPKDS